jgi:hypothetical protein
MLYAMCGFANFGSLGIMIAGLAAMAPERRDDIVVARPEVDRLRHAFDAAGRGGRGRADLSSGARRGRAPPGGRNQTAAKPNSSSMQPEFAVDGLQFRRLDQLAVRDLQ